ANSVFGQSQYSSYLAVRMTFGKLAKNLEFSFCQFCLRLIRGWRNNTIRIGRSRSVLTTFDKFHLASNLGFEQVKIDWFGQIIVRAQLQTLKNVRTVCQS